MYKAVFFDIDGTLLSRHHKTIPQSCKTALHKLKEKGYYIGIATGRHQIEIKTENLLEDLTFDFYVTLNGQLCYHQDQLVYANPIASIDVKKMIDISLRQHIPVMFVEENDLYINLINENVVAAQASIHTAIPPLRPVTHQPDNPIYQMCPYPDIKDLSALATLEHCSITQWHQAAYDIIPASGSKTEGITQVLRPFQITLDQVICFGDGDNDCDMLEKCGLGIAMADGSQKALEAADEITGSVDQDGIYQALLAHHLIEA